MKKPTFEPEVTEAEWCTLTDPWPLWRSLPWYDFDRRDRRRLLLAVGVCRRYAPYPINPLGQAVIRLAEVYADASAKKREFELAHDAVYDACDKITPTTSWLEAAAMHAVANLGLDTTRLGRAAEWAGSIAGYRAALEAGLVQTDEWKREASEALRQTVSVTASARELATVADLVRDVYGNPFRTPEFQSVLRTSAAIGLASAIYEERKFDRMPILADALKEAGCDNPDILTHCRGDGPHARGCWVVDLVLGKS